MNLSDPVELLPATSPITIKRFKSLEINTIYDLLQLFPNRYENYSLVTPILRATAGETVTIQGVVKEFKNTYARRGITIQKATLEDTTGDIQLTWFNQPYLARIFQQGLHMSVAGLVKAAHSVKTMDPKEYEVIRNPGQPTVHTGRFVPIYPERKGLSSRTVRDKMWIALHALTTFEGTLAIEWMPEEIRSRYNLLKAERSYRNIHFPTNLHDANEARKRIAFDELFIVQLSAALVRAQWKKETIRLPFNITTHKKKINSFIAELPFTLTAAQNTVVTEILNDLQVPHPMNRFVQGDVGSGKTVIAAIAAYAAYLNGYQTFYMAPTEILAKQHFATFEKLLAPLNVKVGLQTGTIKTKKGEQYDVIIGTHALLTKTVKGDNVGLVIIDEQHRFGVAQRSVLKEKGINPHLLTMTATPIPRTIALTIYGELDLSIVNELPQGRLPIKSYLVPPEKRERSYDWIKAQIKQHNVQVFIICPLIEESETETMKSVKAATKEYEHLKNDVFTHLKVGLLHGKMSAKEKNELMTAFNNHDYDILVTTSVVEVGIDVPNATIMIIEASERFGLAQLHQLRGRVGRGTKQSYCFLFTNATEPTTVARLHYFTKTNSGIELAEYDLKKRGAGEIYGLRQHGYSDLKIASFSDTELIKATKDAVTYFTGTYEVHDFPSLQEKLKQYQINHIARD